MKEIQLEVITPSKAAFSGMVYSVTLPGSLGNFQVLYNHAPILSALDIGIIKIVGVDNKEMVFATSGGTVEVLNNKVVVLAETFEKPEEIDRKRAEDAKKRAKERLAKKTDEIVDEMRAEMSLKRAINRLNLSEYK